MLCKPPKLTSSEFLHGSRHKETRSKYKSKHGISEIRILHWEFRSAGDLAESCAEFFLSELQ